MRKLVQDIKIGDKVDLSSCPYLFDDPSAEFEYAEVDYVGINSKGVEIGYLGIDIVYYPHDTELEVK